MFRPQGDFEGLAKEGLPSALAYYGLKNAVVLVSERGHYSLGKAVDVLGIGRNN